MNAASCSFPGIRTRPSSSFFRAIAKAHPHAELVVEGREYLRNQIEPLPYVSRFLADPGAAVWPCLCGRHAACLLRSVNAVVAPANYAVIFRVNQIGARHNQCRARCFSLWR